MKRNIILAALITCGSIFYLNSNTPHQDIVCITQIVPHPSLDLIRQGIQDTLKDKNIKIEFQDAQGNITLTTQIAHKFISMNPKVIVPITTPSAQGVLSVSSSIPIVYAAVCDPEASKLVSNNERVVVGVCDFPPLKEQMDLIKKMCPKAKRIGVIYNPSEANSVAIVAKLKKEHHIIEGVVSNVTNIGGALDALLPKIDVLYIPNDNTVVSALAQILKKAHKIPVFASDPQSVERGCVAAVAFDQYKIGQQTGDMVLRILKGEKIKTYELVRETQTYFNKDACKRLNMRSY
jgi:putative ABC transport system substrate-binding protein